MDGKKKNDSVVNQSQIRNTIKIPEYKTTNNQNYLVMKELITFSREQE